MRAAKDGATPLTLANRPGNAELAELLLSRGASANAIGLKGKTPLWWAATVDRKGGAGDGEIVPDPLAAGANPLPPGESPLDDARGWQRQKTRSRVHFPPPCHHRILLHHLHLLPGQSTC